MDVKFVANLNDLGGRNRLAVDHMGVLRRRIVVVRLHELRRRVPNAEPVKPLTICVLLYIASTHTPHAP